MSGSFVKKALLTGVTLAAIAGGAYTVFKPGQQAGAEEGAHGMMPGGAMPVMPAKVVVIENKPVRLWSSYSGRLEAVDFVELRPQVDGRIDEILFQDGQVVEKGDVLFVIDPRPYEAAKAEAEAAVKAATSQSELATKELKRAEELIKTEAISQRTLDERRNAARLAKNALDAANALLARAEINLDHAYLKAPISGRISRAEITVGNVVSEAAAPILSSIVSNEGIYADFEVDEQTYLNTIQSQTKGSEAERAIPVQMVLNNGSTYNGNIKSFDNRINTSSGTIRARAYFDNADGSLLPGMFVTVRLGSAEASEAIVLTEQAVSTDQDRKFVYTVDDSGKVVYREVVLGAAVNGSRVITSGLAPGDKVIVEGIMKIQPGMMVAPEIITPEPAVAPEPAPQEQIAPAPLLPEEVMKADPPAEPIMEMEEQTEEAPAAAE